MSKKQSRRLSPRAWLGLIFRQPPRGLYQQPSIYLCGNAMEIEHFRRIVTYDETKLCVELRRGRFTVYGDELKIVTLAARRITLKGKFLRTDWADE